MKAKYKSFLFIIGIMLLIILTLGLGYYIYRIEQRNNTMTKESGCIRIIYTNKSEEFKIKLSPILDSDGAGLSPFSVTLTNICSKNTDIELRVNIPKEENVNLGAIKLFMNGDIDIEPTIYDNLKNSESTTDSIISKIATTKTLKRGESLRINIRMWLGESSEVSNANEYISAKLEVSENITNIIPTFSETILSNNDPKSPSSNLKELETDLGTSYYFKGNVSNNYVSFADKLWRIIRINENGSVRLILETSPYDYGKYNLNAKGKESVGYIYPSEETNVDSEIKGSLLSWYESNLNEYDSYIIKVKYCNDTSGIEDGENIVYSAYNRLIEGNSPNLNCPSTAYNYGGLYEEKIGLITADELIISKGYDGLTYLSNGFSFYTMTPSRYDNSTSLVFALDQDGNLIESSVSQPLSIRPVINLTSNIYVSGNGTEYNPYVVLTENE